MQQHIKSVIVFFLLILDLLFSSAIAPVENKYNLSKEHTITIHGTSNLHDWNENVETVSGDATINWNKDGSFDLDALSIKMDVHSIKSSEGSIMNSNTYKALKADANPEISFILSTPLKSQQAKSSGQPVSAKGYLMIAGISKSIEMPVKITSQDHGKIAVEGSKTIKMTDYGITPPVALFGTLKTGDEITISFKTNFITTSN